MTDTQDEELAKTVEQYLEEITYGDDHLYKPGAFALEFVNFIKLVNGAQGEENLTPVVHLKMLDQISGRKQKIVNMCARGMAKLESASSPILTPTGWSTMGAIQVGAYVMDRYGNPVKVAGKTEPMRPRMYLMTMSDGSTMEVGDEHNHIVTRYSRGKQVEKVVTTKEMLARGVTCPTPKRKSTRDPKAAYRFRIPLAEPINFATKSLDIAPYTMGYGIANGSFDRSLISFHSEDAVEVTKYIEDEGYAFSSSRSTSQFGTQSKMVGHVFNAYTQLRSKDKYIPDDYMIGSVTQRTELLRGLMDGDGTVSANGSSTYSTYSVKLADDVRDLVRSLGGYSTVKSHTHIDHGGVEYTVRVQLKINPFKLKRKADRWKPTTKLTKAVVSLEEFECKEDGFCIYIDSDDHSYVSGGYTVTHNTTLLGEYLFLYIGVFGAIPGFGKIPLALYVSDSIENGVKNMRKNLEFRWENSEFLQEYIPKTRFTDVRWEFINKDGGIFIVKGYGAKALSLDSKLFTESGSITIGDCQVGDKIFGADGKLATITKKSEVFNKPMYKLSLEDGRELKVSEDHINSIVHKENVNNNATYARKDLCTHELIDLPLVHSRNRKRKGKSDYVSNENLVFIENCRPLEYSPEQLPLDPYTLGLLLGDGSMKKDGSNVLHAHIDDMPEYLAKIPYEMGAGYVDKRNGTVVSQSIKGISARVRLMGVNVHGDHKFVPVQYLRGSIEQRLELLKGLLDTDGSIQKNGRIDFCSNSEQLVDGVSALVRSLGGTTKKRSVGKAFRIEIWIEYVPFNLQRKAIRFKNRTKNLVAVISIERIADEPSQCIAIDNEEHQFIVNDYFRTHNTGVRGAKELGTRPTLAVLDDLVSDEDARSATVIESIEATVHKAVNFALHPKNNKTVWSGTPFNAKDPLYKVVESGAWYVSVYPVCEKFPCTEEEFRGGWEDRFTYDYVNTQYQTALKLGKVDTFNQELMLRIMSDDDRLILDCDISWYLRRDIMANMGNFNFYITTDFATSEKTAADFSVISVWAYNALGEWFWVDGVVKRQDMKKNVDDLFRLAAQYKPQQVGIEVSGQQGGFIQWIKSEMMNRNQYFVLASESNKGAEGIRPNTNKMQRFQIVVPWFKNNMIYFPEERKTSPEIAEAINELSLAAANSFRSKNDDFLDTISMLASLKPWKPTAASAMAYDSKNDVWGWEDEDEGCGGLGSYTV